MAMRSVARRILTVVTLLSVAASSTVGEGQQRAVKDTASSPSGSETFDSERSYDLLRYDEAISLLMKLIEQEAISPDQMYRAREIIARCYVKKGYPVLAKEMFKANLRHLPGYRPDPLRVPPDEWVVFEQARKEFVAEGAADSLVRPAVRAKPGGESTLEVRARPQASIYVDGILRAQNAASARIALGPGFHDVRAVHPVYGSQEWRVETKPQGVTRLSHDFLDASTGSMRVSSGGIWGEVYIDGVNTGEITPCIVEGLLPGRHSVSVERARFQTVGAQQTVTIQAGQTAVAQFRLRSRQRAR